jgi:hypothetical protein
MLRNALDPSRLRTSRGSSDIKQQQYQAKFRADSGSNLHLQPYNRGYALSESGELIAIITYRKGAVRVAQLLAQAWPQRFGRASRQHIVSPTEMAAVMPCALTNQPVTSDSPKQQP